MDHPAHRDDASVGAAIRPARASDAAELADLCCQLGYPTTLAEMSERLPQLLRLTDHHVAVAAGRDDRAVGFIHAEVRRQLQSELFVQVVVLVVEDGQRGAGAGLALLSEAEAWARRSGVSLIRLTSNIIRERAHRFYLRHGYSQVKTSHLFAKRLA